MLKFTINGNPMKDGDLEEEVMRVAAESAAQGLRDRLSAIRHPDTGEFATVVVDGDSLDDMVFRVEGSAALLELVKQRLSPEEVESMSFVEAAEIKLPRAFLSYAWEDRELAKRVAEGLQANGVDTWWAEWELGAGDSLRRKIDTGLGDCTHFIVLLTPVSITRPWVNEEIDAGFVRKVNAKSRFIPLRHGLMPSELPPLMSGILSPEVDANAANLLALVNDIHGVSKKPALGQAPAAARAPTTGYSGAATAIAGMFVTRSEHGEFGDPQLTTDELVEQAALSGDDVADALHELRHRVQISFENVLPKATLYSEFDSFWQPWKPADDALRLASDLVNDPEFPTAPAEIADRYGWAPRRLNPAITYLLERDAIRVVKAVGTSPYVTAHVDKTDGTRRFVRSRS